MTLFGGAYCTIRTGSKIQRRRSQETQKQEPKSQRVLFLIGFMLSGSRMEFWSAQIHSLPNYYLLTVTKQVTVDYFVGCSEALKSAVLTTLSFS